MNAIVKIPKITFADSVSAEIQRTIGTFPAETGGVLGGNLQTGEITHFYFDEHAVRTPVTYTVEANRINPVIEEWNQADIHLMGFCHSHPRGCEQPSAPDVEYARRILNRADNRALDRFLIPIVQTAASGTFSMRLFSVVKNSESTIYEIPYNIAPLSELLPFPVTSIGYQKTFARVRESYDLKRLHHSMIIAVGCGGASSFLEDLARGGVRFFVLIDPDVVEDANLATQQCYRKDIGLAKVEAIKQRILDINPLAVVTAIQQPLDAFSDADFRTLVFETGCAGEELETRVLCALTDSFWAQMRTNLLALHFTLPSLSAQVYKNGAAAEVVFTHPATTRQCSRCILSQRYRAYIEQGFKNDVKTQGAQYYATLRLNATKFFVTMAVLHHGTEHGFWGEMLARIDQRNCIQIRCDPDVEKTLGMKNFAKAFAGAAPDRLFSDESIFLPQHPENRANGYGYDCPDCGGTGNLLDSQGRFGDTRRMVADAKELAESNHFH